MKLVMQNMNISIFTSLPINTVTLQNLVFRNLGKLYPFPADLIRYKTKQTTNINILYTQDLSYLENKTEFLCLVSK